MTETEIRQKLETIIEIVRSTDHAYQLARYLNTGDTSEEHRVAHSNSFIRNARHAFWYMAVIEACKLFQNKDNQKHNLHKLLNIIGDNRGKAFLRGKITLADIQNWRGLLNSQEISDTTAQLGNLRNRLYAHTDKVPDLFADENTPYFHDVDVLLNVAKRIMSGLKSKIDDAHLIFNELGTPGAKNILNILIEDRKRHIISAEEDLIELRRRMYGDKHPSPHNSQE